MLLVSSCSSGQVRDRVRLVVWNPPASGSVREGGLSDLTLDASDPSGRSFFAINDRGPNLAEDGVAAFPFPSYHQKIFRFRLGDDDSIRLKGIDSIRDGDGRWTTGLPSPFFPSSERAVALAPTGRAGAIPSDSAGYDFEGLAGDGAGGFWASEEYGPRLVHLGRDSSGIRIDRVLSPGRGLPSVFARRARNKGLEALCRTPGGRLVAFFQGALDNSPSQGVADIAERSLARRILVHDPRTGSVQELIEQVDDDPKGKKSHRTKTGACTAIDETGILVLEHRRRGKGKVEVDLVRLDLSAGKDVHLSSDSLGWGMLHQGRSIEEVATSRDGLASVGLRAVGRSVLVPDLTDGLGGELAKPEGLVLLSDSTFVIVFDNDFGIEDGRRDTRFLLGRLPPSRRSSRTP